MGILKNILILNAGTRNVLVQNFKQTIHKQCNIIVTDSYRLAPALYDADKCYVTKRWDEDGYWDEIKQICIKENVGLILSLVDPELELLASQKKTFEQMGIIPNIADEKTVKATYDKMETQKFLKKNHYNSIASYVDYDSAEKSIIENKISFPLIVKPRKGSGSVGVEIVNNINQLKQLCEQNDDVIIQEYIDGQELGVDVYVDLLSNQVVSIFAKKKIKMRAGETDKSVSYKDEKLFQLISDFTKKFGLMGVNDIDVFEKDGEYYISEINPRFGGGYIHAYAAGVDFPQLLLNNMNGVVNEKRIGDYKENLYMMKYFSMKIADEEDLI